jgi:hypothetical protein
MLELCNQRSTAEASIARQWFARHVSAATDMLVETKMYVLPLMSKTKFHTHTKQ